MFRKKIVFAIDRLGMGGAENMLIEQIKAIDKTIFQVFLITIFPNPSINLKYKIFSDVEYIPFNFSSPFSGLFDIISWWKLFIFFWKEKFDAVVTSLFITNTIVRIVASLTHVPVILSSELNLSEDKRKWQIIVDKILARFTKKILVSSLDVLEFTSKQENISKEKFCLNYNAIPLELYGVKKNRDQVLTEYGLPTDSFYIVTAGRLIEQKGHKYLIEATKKLLDSGISDFQVLIFGKGELQVELEEKISALNLQNHMRLMGIGSMDKILAISDIFVFPSLWEGLSISLLQAMDSGSPIIATNISGSNEAIVNNESGLLVAPRDSGELTSALMALIKDPSNRERLSKNAHIRAEKFSIGNNVKVIEKLVLMK